MTILVDDVLNKSGITSTDKNSVKWPVAERLVWLNEGARSLCTQRKDAYVKRTAVTLVAGAKQTLPDDAISLLDVRTASGSVRVCDKAALDAFDKVWQNRTTGSVINYMVSPGEYPVFWVCRGGVGGSNDVELVCQSYPTTPVVGGTLPIQSKYEANLVNYMLYRMYSKLAETGASEKAVAYLQLFSA